MMGKKLCFKLWKPASFFYLVLIGLIAACSSHKEEKVLVFYKPSTDNAVSAGAAVITQLGKESGFAVDTTAQSTSFNEDNLKQYSAVVFLNAPGEALTVNEQTDFERFVQAGGGYVGIHAPIQVKYNWPWYEKMLNVRKNSGSHPEFDETPVKLMANKEENGSQNQQELISFSKEYDGGRVAYLDNTKVTSSLSSPEEKQAVAEAINFAIGDNQLNYNNAHSLRTPEENRFVKNVLVYGGLDEPTELEVLPDGKVIVVERKGAVKLYSPEDNKIKTIAQLNVHTKFEDGLMGVAKDPDFYHNNWIYMYYSPAGDEWVQHLSRFKLIGDSMLLSSEKLMLKVPVQRETCCHTGGSIEFGPSGLLYLSTGDDTNPFASDGHAPIDERPGRSSWDAQGTSGNTNDLRGKVLRIKPEPDGTYSIPDGNLFPKDGSEGKPEIYVMGCRNPYRISVDPKTGYLYWGDVGNDARFDTDKGPKGYDEINQAKEAGNFGWPFFRGNRAYPHYNFATGEIGPYFDFEAPVNNSPNNTGIDTLPPFKEALIWYPYDESPEFPIVGTGGRNAMAGPVYYYDMYSHYDHRFPEYYDKKLFVYDWIREWIMAVTLDEKGDLVRLEPFLDSFTFSNPIDMRMGYNGNMYVLEYGDIWFAANPEASLSRIDYAEGNRKPNARIAADKTLGAAPLTVTFSSSESFDYDSEDQLSYQWAFTADDQSSEPNPSFTFEKPGIYHPKVTITDASGASDTQELEIQVGNEMPDVRIVFTGNNSFYWNDQTINYQVKVTDKEDGSLDEGIEPSKVSFFYDYLPEGNDVTASAAGHQQNTASMNGLALIDKKGCKTCHSFEQTSVGPAYNDVAKRYNDDEETTAKLVTKVLKGGSGTWGDRAMPPQAVTTDEAETIVKYVLSLDQAGTVKLLPLRGGLVANKHLDQGAEGKYVFTATYEDAGGEIIGPLTTKKIATLRNPKVQVETFDQSSKASNKVVTPDGENYTYLTEIRKDDYFAFSSIDLKYVDLLTLKLSATGKAMKIDVRTDSLKGRTILAFEVPFTGAPDKWQEIDIPVTDAPVGVHDLYFVVKNEGEVPDNEEKNNNMYINADWINFRNSYAEKKMAIK